MPNSRKYEKQDLRGLKKICAQNEFRRLAMEQSYAESEVMSHTFEPATGEELS